MSKNLSEPIRSHKDLDKDSAPLYHKAVKFYEGLSKQLVHQGHVLDLFACALDQVILISVSGFFFFFFWVCVDSNLGKFFDGQSLIKRGIGRLALYVQL